MHLFKEFAYYFVFAAIAIAYMVIQAVASSGQSNADGKIWLVICLIAFVVFYIIPYIIHKWKINKAEKHFNYWVDHMKSEGEKIDIDLAQVLISESTAANYKGNYESDENQDKNKKKEDPYFFLLKIPYKGAYKNQIINTTHTIDNIKMHFELKKKTNLYTINDEAYFDLEFLDGHKQD